MSIENFLMFVSIAFIATITPGPAVLLVSANSINYGVQGAVTSILGNITGLFLMSLLSVLGLSALILHSAAVFLVVKLIGAGYLIYLGVKIWCSGFMVPRPMVKAVTVKHRSGHRLYLQGLMVALSNPKAIAFTTALFPQFIEASQPLLLQFSILVLSFMFLSFACLFGYALAAHHAGSRASYSRAGRWVGRAFGSAFILSGLALANASQK